ncbi:unnamed protein product [Arctia plantaginis]|uniref:Uncharacterized protein n=1 Tax=Arctia plantaginis TaxID=874455 RepID=A0A8S1A932_ARCPL|nr:unnamed protein product [Arctia plantaginis]
MIMRLSKGEGWGAVVTFCEMLNGLGKWPNPSVEDVGGDASGRAASPVTSRLGIDYYFVKDVYSAPPCSYFFLLEDRTVSVIIS